MGSLPRCCPQTRDSFFASVVTVLKLVILSLRNIGKILARRSDSAPIAHEWIRQLDILASVVAVLKLVILSLHPLNGCQGRCRELMH